MDTLTKKQKQTLVVNLFGGPGAGKSTKAFGLCYELKMRGYDIELAHEYAKDLTWNKRHYELQDQPYVFGKQWHRIYSLLGQVEMVITDSPILLGCYYGRQWGEDFCSYVKSLHRQTWHTNIFLKRVKPYNPNGRNQTEEEAEGIDEALHDLFRSYQRTIITGDRKGLDEALSLVEFVYKTRNGA